MSHASVPSREANSLQVMKMCAAFARAGHALTLHCRPGPEAGDAHAFYGLEPRFALSRVQGGELRLVRRFLYSWRTAAQLACAAPELLFGRDYHTLALLAHRAGPPLALEVHQPPGHAFERRLMGRLLAAPRLALLVSISQALADEYRARYPHLRAPILVAHDGADAPAGPLPPPRPAGRPLELGYVGNLYPGKGMELIECLAARLPQAVFHVLGGTPADVAAWRARVALPNVRLHGHVPHAEAQARMRDVDVLLAPYRAAVLIGGGGADIGRWMSPLKVFEYMASGRPLVASDLPVLREVLVDGVNARLAPADDVEAWARILEELAREPAQGRALAERARAELVTHYSWDVRVQRILAALAPRAGGRAEVRA